MYDIIRTIVVSTAFVFVIGCGRVLAQSPTLKQYLIEVKSINIKGNTIFSNSELKKIVGSVEGKTVSLERLFQIRNEIEQFYLDRGYISSGAFLPRQKLEDGIITIRVIEGSLNAIEIEGLFGLSEKYVKARLPELDKPLKITDLAQALKRLEQDPLIKKIGGELTELEPGSNLLSLVIEENKPIQTQLKFTNAFSPTIGSFGGSATVLHQNLVGFGDRASVDYTRTEGLERYGVGYSIPFNSSGGRVSFDYDNADSELIEKVISAFDIQADFEGYKLFIQQPVIRNEAEELTFSLGLEKLRSETFVAKDISFPFVDGLEDGVSRITPLRLGTEYTRRGNNSLIAAKSQFNVGLNILDATSNDAGIDGSFWSWQGNVQWIKAFDSDGDWLFRTSLLTQQTPDELLPLEQLTVGGLGSVRGYRQNLIVGDNGVVAIAEGQLPVIISPKWGNVYLVPFADFGTVWSNDSDPSSFDIQTDTLASVGLELNYRIENFLDTKVFYGIPLSETEDFGDSEVEEKWGFSFSIIPLRF